MGLGERKGAFERMKQPFYYLSGWTHLGFVVIIKLPQDLQEKLKKVYDAVTVSKKDRYIRYINHGFVTASHKRPVADFYRRFERRF